MSPKRPARPTTPETARALINNVVHAYFKAIPSNNFDQPFYRSQTCISARPGTPTTPATCVFEMTVPETYVNSPDPKHPVTQGGAVAAWFDGMTSMAMMLDEKGWEWGGTSALDSGVSRNLNVSYFRPVIQGDKVLVECETVQCGALVATIRGVMRRASDGVVLATCQHDKVRVTRPSGTPGGARL
jgi:acyl-coenzyme A thioesterase 13